MSLRQLPLAEKHRLLRFGVTGCAGFVMDFGTLVVLHGILGTPLAIATICAYAAGGTVHYTLSRFWVFPQDGAGELGRLSRYILLVGVNVGLTLLFVLGLTHLGLDYWVAKLVAVAVLFFSNYVIMPKLVMTSPALTEFPVAEAAHHEPGAA